MWYIFTYLIPAYSLLCKGIANNDAVAYRSARTALYPLFCINNNTNFAQVSLRDQSVAYRCTEEMAQVRDKLVGMHGQPIDFITENAVSAVKKNVGSNTQSAYEVAAYMASCQTSDRDALATLNNRKVRSNNPLEERTSSNDQLHYRSEIYNTVIARGWLQPQIGRESVYTVNRRDGTTTDLAKGGGACQLMKIGTARAAANAVAFRNGEKLPSHELIDLSDEKDDGGKEK